MKFPQNASLKDMHGKMWSRKLLPQQLHSVDACVYDPLWRAQPRPNSLGLLEISAPSSPPFAVLEWSYSVLCLFARITAPLPPKTSRVISIQRSPPPNHPQNGRTLPFNDPLNDSEVLFKTPIIHVILAIQRSPQVLLELAPSLLWRCWLDYICSL